MVEEGKNAKVRNRTSWRNLGKSKPSNEGIASDLPLNSESRKIRKKTTERGEEKIEKEEEKETVRRMPATSSARRLRNKAVLNRKREKEQKRSMTE